MLILGIDPGTHRIGYGAVQKEGGVLSFLEAGILPLPETLPRLPAIEAALEALLVRLKPDRVGMERLFFTRNQKTAIGVAQARGVLVNCLQKRGTPLLEFSPSEIKLAVTGSGTADKRAVADMTFRFLSKKPERFLDDATDALAAAITASSRRIDSVRN